MHNKKFKEPILNIYFEIYREKYTSGGDQFLDLDIVLGLNQTNKYPATTNVQRLDSVKNCPCKNIVIVSPYLTYYDHLV